MFWGDSVLLNTHFTYTNLTSKTHLIIRDENTKEITTKKEVWKPCLYLHRFWRFYSFDFFAFNDRFEKLYQGVSSGIQTPCSGLKKILAAHCFLTHFSVFGYPIETLFLVFDILLTIHNIYSVTIGVRKNGTPKQGSKFKKISIAICK